MCFLGVALDMHSLPRLHDESRALLQHHGVVALVRSVGRIVDLQSGEA